MTTDTTPAIERGAEAILAAYREWNLAFLGGHPVEPAPTFVSRAVLTSVLDGEEMAALIPAPRVSVHVEDWPADEQDLFRNGFNDGRWTDYTNRAEALDLLRRRKVAEALRAAILGDA